MRSHLVCSRRVFPCPAGFNFNKCRVDVLVLSCALSLIAGGTFILSPNLNQLFRVHTIITRVVARRGYPARARMPTTEETNPGEVKRPRLTMDATPDTPDPPRANDRVIDQTLGDDAEHPMRELFESWGLPDRFVQGVSPSWRCKLVPLARTEDCL